MKINYTAIKPRIDAAIDSGTLIDSIELTFREWVQFNKELGEPYTPVGVGREYRGVMVWREGAL